MHGTHVLSSFIAVGLPDSQMAIMIARPPLSLVFMPFKKPASWYACRDVQVALIGSNLSASALWLISIGGLSRGLGCFMKQQ